MKRKMKLTDLRQVETSKEEMGFVKGGEELEKGIPWCIAGCDCTTACIIQNGDKNDNSETMTSTRTGGSAMNLVWGVVTAGISLLI